MPCNPADNNLNPPQIPALPIPGLGIPIAPIQLPLKGFKFPPIFPELLEELFALTKINWPGAGDLLANLDDTMNNIMKAIANILSMLMPFLSLYNFFQALLNMVNCIIEVLCALPRPRKTIRAVKKLLKRCLPNFLKLFPWLALLAMIIALLFLILAIINYIISKIIDLINDIIRNFKILTSGATFQDEEAVAAAAMKLANMLCLIQNLFAIFSMIATIIAIINTLAQLAGKRVCSKNGNSDCCTEDACPTFISDTEDGFTGTQGTLLYYKQIKPNYTSGELEERNETWQFYNSDPSLLYQFNQIVTPVDTIYGEGSIFWPDPLTFNKNDNSSIVPYIGKITIRDFDPGWSDGFTDNKGPRDFVIENLYVSIKPYIGVLNQENDLEDYNELGTLQFLGGKVYELDDEGNKTSYKIGGTQATIENFIHRTASSSGELPNIDDGYLITNIEYQVLPNIEALVHHELIGYGCVPEIAAEAAIIDAQFADTRSVFEKIGEMPDYTAAQSCMNDALAKLRLNVTEETIREFESTVLGCLTDIQQQTASVLCAAFINAVDPYSSTFSVSPDVQFVTSPITAKVVLRDVNGIEISNNIAPECSSSILTLLQGHVTLGSISGFSYVDNELVANITSSQAGNGKLTVSFNNNYFQEIINRDNDNVPSEFKLIEVDYTFIGSANAGSGHEQARSEQRRDERDVNNI